MKRKQLSEFPAFTKACETFEKVEREGVQVRDRLIEIENRLTAAVRENREKSALAMFEAEESPETIKRAELREEFGRLEERQGFLSEALEGARREKENARGQASLIICNEVRPAFVELINRLLAALKTACDANDELGRLRDELEAEGITTGSIPFCLIPDLGKWDDEMALGIAARYRLSIKNNFAEIKRA